MLRRNIKWERCVRGLLVTANIVPSSPILVTLMIEALNSSETLVLTRATQHNSPEGGILHHCPCLEKLGFLVFSVCRYGCVPNLCQGGWTDFACQNYWTSQLDLLYRVLYIRKHNILKCYQRPSSGEGRETSLLGPLEDLTSVIRCEFWIADEVQKPSNSVLFTIIRTV
jgi:hypothetical protein